MSTRLFVIPGSHPSMAARLMLEHKGVPYKRTDLISAVHKPIVRALGFPGNTVPALKIDGRRVQGTGPIARELDELRPEPPLLPRDPSERSAVEEAERFGDSVLQSVPRRLSWWAIKRNPSAARSFLEGARIGVPVPVAARLVAPVAWISARLNEADDDAVRSDLEQLPDLLDRVDGLVEQGVIGGDQPNVADFQIATSMRLLLCFDDLRPSLDGRPGAELGQRLVPGFPGRVGAVFPPAWLEPLRGGTVPAA